MPAYHAINGDTEHSPGRPASADSSRSRYALQCTSNMSRLTANRQRSARGRKEVGMIGQASWISSVINLVNTSMEAQYTERKHKLKIV